MIPVHERTLLELVTAPQEADYLQHFQALSTVNLEIRQRGASPERLLQKSILEADIGNFQAALDAARDASDLRPDMAEARYQEGMSLILLAFTKVGVLAGAPNMPTPIARPRVLLEQAAEAFSQSVQANPDDEEAAEDLAALSGFLATTDDDGILESALRKMFE